MANRSVGRKAPLPYAAISSVVISLRKNREPRRPGIYVGQVGIRPVLLCLEIPAVFSLIRGCIAHDKARKRIRHLVLHDLWLLFDRGILHSVIRSNIGHDRVPNILLIRVTPFTVGNQEVQSVSRFA